MQEFPRDTLWQKRDGKAEKSGAKRDLPTGLGREDVSGWGEDLIGDVSAITRGRRRIGYNKTIVITIIN